MFSLNSPITQLTKVGNATAKKLSLLGINRVGDLFFYFPFRYDDFSKMSAIKDLKINETVTIKGRLIAINNKKSFRRHIYITEALISDDSGTIKAVWFNQPFLIKNFKVGEELYLAGRVEQDYLGLFFSNPSYEKAKAKNSQAINTARLVPIYHLSSNVTQKIIRYLIALALKQVREVTDWLPQILAEKYQLLDLVASLQNIHFPKNKELLQKSLKRLKFDELFLIFCKSQIIRRHKDLEKSPAISFKQDEIKKFIDSLKYTLTPDQKKAAWEILLDLQKNQPMNRLLEGDVGSGKTIVAFIGALNTILNGFQVAYMAPTEILANQHYATALEFLAGQNKNIALLTAGRQSLNGQDISREELLNNIINGQIDLVIGTHALIGDQVSFKNLGLVIIDEQHRFGVKQREALKKQNRADFSPHFLSMTATPIPRSLALIVYGDLDLSIIKQMPKGRKPIITKVVEENNRLKAYDFMRRQVEAGRQIFVICPLIDPSDKLGYKSVKEEFKRLDKEIFPEIPTALLHGRLKAKEKEQVMADFKANKTKILVSTSVIEVGIDIPNATIMMIEGADRFGLAQLHQFRGRVGRGEHQSYCFLFAGNDLKENTRLRAMEKSSDGFALAEYDLKFRGPGEVFGLRQSGMPEFKIATLNDLEMIKLTKAAAAEFLSAYQLNDFPLLASRLSGLEGTTHLE